MAGAARLSGLQIRAVPKALGVVLVAAIVSYLLDVLAAFLVPGVATQIHPFLTIVPIIAEVWMLLYLLVKGVKVPVQDTPTASAGTTRGVLADQSL